MVTWAAVWQWLGTGAVAAVISAVIAWPKYKGEGKQAEGAGEKALTEAQIARQLDALAGAEKATQRAEKACSECKDELAAEKVERAREIAAERDRTAKRDRVIDLLIDAWLEALPLLPADADATRNLRAVVATARRARYDYTAESPPP